MRRRRTMAGLAFAVSIGLVAAMIAGTASAASDREAAHQNSLWLAKQLRADGTFENPNGGTLPDHGLMLDVLFAAYASGDGAVAEPIVDYLDDQGHATDYFTWDGLIPDSGFEAVITGGAAAKTLVAAQISGRDPRNFDGHDMIAETKAAIRRSGPDIGRVSDYSKNPEYADFVTNNANVFGQAIGVIGLAAAGENDQLAIDKLVTQQCSEGYFRIFFALVKTDETGDHVTPDGYKISSCDEGKATGVSPSDGDTTGLGLSAMLAAKRAGAQGLDAPIARAVSWLAGNQSASGGWGGGVGTEAPNTNSTGLVVQALADAGGSEALVDRGVAFLKSAQATAAADSGNSLSNDIGAIAYNPESYVAARGTGIAGVDTWIRAGAQASLGLSQVGFYALATGGGPEPTSSSTTTTTTSKTTTTTTPATRTETTTAAPNTTVPAPKPKATTPKATAPKAVTRQVPPPTKTQERPDTATPASKLGAYLADRLVGGDHVEVTENDQRYVDHDATADLVLALRALGEQPDAVDRATKFLLTPDAVEAYAHGAPYEQGEAAYAEPLAKLVVIAEFAQATDHVSRFRADLLKLRGDDGTFTDKGAYADANATVKRHSWAMLATAPDPGRSVEALLQRQCADGTFPEHLDADRCESGDVGATAAAVTALAARTHTDDVPPSGKPDGWSDERTSAFVRAVTALGTRSTSRGLVEGEAGQPDVALSAAVAATRQFAGLDASETARSLGELVLADGGLTKGAVAASDGRTDFPTSLAAAQGVAGRSWLTAAGSPLSPAVRLPLADVTADVRPQAVDRFTQPQLLLWGLGALGGLLLLGALLVLVLRRLINTKGVTP
ncbi:hypothetical protein ACFWN2_03365 [Lentzea sp. NPDC058436]|uniref:hypothetical protein n=1 Tax=Lentzea sp. NPDC058436 TaxID=3346499 RepID=UPI003669B6F4